MSLLTETAFQYRKQIITGSYKQQLIFTPITTHNFISIPSEKMSKSKEWHYRLQHGFTRLKLVELSR